MGELRAGSTIQYSINKDNNNYDENVNNNDDDVDHITVKV